MNWVALFPRSNLCSHNDLIEDYIRGSLYTDYKPQNFIIKRMQVTIQDRTPVTVGLLLETVYEAGYNLSLNVLIPRE